MLSSELFSGDVLLEAAANGPAGHITSGARGRHVVKIQGALNALDSAGLDLDGVYGPITASAVQRYKQARDIVNRAYQAAADNIVGVMTIKAMDNELLRLPPSPGPAEIVVVAPLPEDNEHTPRVVAYQQPNSFSGLIFASAIRVPPSFDVGTVTTISKGQTAKIIVKNAKFAILSSMNPAIASIKDPSNAATQTSFIKTDSESFEIVGNKRGSTVILVVGDIPGMWPFTEDIKFSTFLTVSVTDNRSTVYVPTMVAHNHLPSGKWKEVLKVIDQPTNDKAGKALKVLCLAGASPRQFVDAAIIAEFRDKPIAFQHLNWYLKYGRGAEYNEDENIARLVKTDANFRAKIRDFIVANITKGLQFSGFFEFWQPDFINQDMRFAFGSLDRVDIEVDVMLATVKIWFKDSYEWHPYCPGYYSQFPDDGPRITNSLNAALVELKNEGAADFWMVGEATLPLSTFLALP
jgi:peptidoglycan hydrolase-like protein with peptidoglycan-binding domain